MKQKSKTQWILEWLGTVFLFFMIIFGILFITAYGLQSQPLFFLILSVLLIGSLFAGIFMLLRTFGVMMIVFFPEKKAKSCTISRDEIVLTLENGKCDVFAMSEVTRLILLEGVNGLFINAGSRKDEYLLPYDYKKLESVIDSINKPAIFTKEKQLLQTNERTDAHKDLTATKTTTQVGGTRGSVEEIVPEHGRMTIYYEKLAAS